MTEKKERDEREVAKEAIKREHLTRIAKELREKAGIKFEEDLRVDDKETKLVLEASAFEISNDKLIGLIKYLGERLADTKAELWLQKKATEK